MRLGSPAHKFFHDVVSRIQLIVCDHIHSGWIELIHYLHDPISLKKVESILPSYLQYGSFQLRNMGVFRAIALHVIKVSHNFRPKGQQIQNAIFWDLQSCVMQCQQSNVRQSYIHSRMKTFETELLDAGNPIWIQWSLHEFLQLIRVFKIGQESTAFMVIGLISHSNVFGDNIIGSL